jgi:hypothetical protein
LAEAQMETDLAEIIPESGINSLIRKKGFAGTIKDNRMLLNETE